MDFLYLKVRHTLDILQQTQWTSPPFSFVRTATYNIIVKELLYDHLTQTVTCRTQQPTLRPPPTLQSLRENISWMIHLYGKQLPLGDMGDASDTFMPWSRMRERAKCNLCYGESNEGKPKGWLLVGINTGNKIRAACPSMPATKDLPVAERVPHDHVDYRPLATCPLCFHYRVPCSYITSDELWVSDEGNYRFLRFTQRYGVPDNGDDLIIPGPDFNVMDLDELDSDGPVQGDS